jgi:hypothetical protein
MEDRQPLRCPHPNSTHWSCDILYKTGPRRHSFGTGRSKRPRLPLESSRHTNSHTALAEIVASILVGGGEEGLYTAVYYCEILNADRTGTEHKHKEVKASHCEFLSIGWFWKATFPGYLVPLCLWVWSRTVEQSGVQKPSKDKTRALTAHAAEI